VPRSSFFALAGFVLLAVSVFVWASDWLTLAWLKTHRDALVAFCQHNMVLTLLVYVGAFAAWAALCLPGVGLFALAGGLVFGQVPGTLLATLAAVCGATLAFLAARHWFHDWAHARFARVFAVIDRGVRRDGAFYVFMMRLVVFVPFCLVNPLMGLTDIALRTFVWASALGMLGNSFLWVNAGTMLGSIERIEDVLSLPVLASFAAVGILPLVVKWLFLRGK
jgi:uncharacterized membrane protein YdjX (TVP38/TMEM64 family)